MESATCGDMQLFQKVFVLLLEYLNDVSMGVVGRESATMEEGCVPMWLNNHSTSTYNILMNNYSSYFPIKMYTTIAHRQHHLSFVYSLSLCTIFHLIPQDIHHEDNALMFEVFNFEFTSTHDCAQHDACVDFRLRWRISTFVEIRCEFHSNRHNSHFT